MEHQTCTSMGGWPTINITEFSICHELAHQWWGDQVTCKTFHHIWLSEGFATYSERYGRRAPTGCRPIATWWQGWPTTAGDHLRGGPATEPIFDWGLSY